MMQSMTTTTASHHDSVDDVRSDTPADLVRRGSRLPGVAEAMQVYRAAPRQTAPAGPRSIYGVATQTNA